MAENSSPDEPKQISRRTFLKRIGVAAAGLGAALAGANAVSQQDQNKVDTAIPVNTPPTPEQSSETIFWQKDGVTVWATENVPTRWQDSSGKEGVFEREKLIEANRQAIADNEPIRFADVQRVTKNIPSVATSEAENHVEKPANILTKEELERRGIEIIQGQDTHLHLRPGAFEPGEILDFHTEDNPPKLKVIITDKAVLNRYAFAGEDYDSVRDLINDVFSLDRTLTPQQIRQELDQNFEYSLENPNQTYYDRNQLALKRAFISELTDQEIIDWGMNPNSTDGLYMHQGNPGKDSLRDTSAIFLAMGSHPTLDCLTISATNQEGQFEVNLTALNLQEAYGLYPTMDLVEGQSFPDPSTITYIESESKLTAGVDHSTVTKSFGVRHEFNHHRRVSRPIANETPAQTWSESTTDHVTYDSLVRANQRYQQNGDDSLYYTVIEVRDKNLVVVG